MNTPQTIPFGSKPLATPTGAQTIPFGTPPSQQKPAPQPAVADSIWSGIAGSVGGAVKQAGAQVNQAFTDPTKNPLQQGFDASVAAAGAVPAVAVSAIPGGTQVSNAIGGAASGAVDWLGKILGGTQQAQDFVTKFPDAANALHQTATVGQGLGTISNTILGAQGIASAGDATVNTVKNVSGTTKGAGVVADTLKPVKEVSAPTKAANDPVSQRISDLISPKVDAKATRLALAEGRIAPGQEPGLLRDGTPDQIMPSKQTVKAVQTVKNQILGADQMTQPDLHAALDKKVTQIATKLQPEMEKVPITDQIVKKMQDSWDTLKTKQAEDPYSPPDVRLEKLQEQFQREFLEPIANKSAESVMNQSLGIQNIKQPTMNELWDNAKAYDQSVPANVKNANSLSTDVLQTQKAIWLQNRAILRDAINDSATGLGETSQKAFSDMSDLYNAQKGIQSSYKIQKEGAPSKLKQFGDSKTGKIAKAVVGTGTALEAGKKVLTGQF